MEVELTRKSLDVARAYRELDDPESGGVVVFVGRVRPDRSKGGTVVALWYEADERMSPKLLRTLVQEAKRRHRARRVVLWHRLGRLRVGEVSVIAGVAAGHRAQAFLGARFLIEGIKQRVPIWKSDLTRASLRATGRRTPASARRPGSNKPGRTPRQPTRPT